MFTLRASFGSADKGARPGFPAFIVIHHWGTPATHRNVKPATIADFLNRPGGNSSAHAVIGPWEVIQICPWQRVAWHAPGANAYGIGLELKPFDDQTPKDEVSAVFETAAWLIAYLWHVCPGLDRKLRWHQQFYNTACPAEWISLIDSLEKRAAEYFPRIDPSKPTATKPLTERKPPKMIMLHNTENGQVFISDGVEARYLESGSLMSKLTQAGIPLVSVTSQELSNFKILTNDDLKATARIRDVKDLLTDSPSMDGSLRETSVLNQIKQEIIK